MPTAASPVYGGPMRLSQNERLRAAQIDANGKTVATTEADFRINDTTPPSVTSSTAMTNADTIRVAFSEPVDKSSAENPSNYKVSAGETVSSAQLQPGGESVLLTLSSPVAAGTAYTIDVEGVLDLSPNKNASHAHGDLALLKPAFQLDAVQTLKGSGTGVRQRVADLPTKGDAPWTINFFVYMDQSPDDLTPIAGFGSGRDDGGAERFMINSDNSVYFWGGGIDISSGVPYDLHRWQMISATYDGHKVRIYKDGKEIKSDDATLSDAASLVRVGPPPAWGYGHQFTGKVAELSIWNDALSEEYLRTLLGTGPAK
jgi:alpha-mannosidase